MMATAYITWLCLVVGFENLGRTPEGSGAKAHTDLAMHVGVTTGLHSAELEMWTCLPALASK